MATLRAHQCQSKVIDRARVSALKALSSDTKPNAVIHLIKTADAGTCIVDRLGDAAAFKHLNSHPGPWVVSNQRSHHAVHLFPGYRCRRTFSRPSPMAGRCFELVVVKDSSLPGSHVPTFTIREIQVDSHGFLERSSIDVHASSPNEV